MSWDVTVTAPEGFPDVQELVVAFSMCPGNIYMSVREMKQKDLKNMERQEAMDALKDLIAEVDKKNEGLFSDTYAVAADMRWSEGKESRREWERYAPYIDGMPFKTYEDYCGYTLRNHLREDAVRFFLYYVSGYKIEYEW